MYRNIDILFIDKNIKKNFDVLNNPKGPKDPKGPKPNNHYSIEENLDLSELSSSFKEKIKSFKEQKTSNHLNGFYHLDTLELLEKYNETLQQPVKISFKNNCFIEEVKNKEEKNIIIENYIDVIKNYDDEIMQEIWNNLEDSKELGICKCKICDFNIMTESTECNNLLICVNCGYQEINLSLVNNFKINHNDSKRIYICPKYSYEKRSHFINTINQFQGKINNKKDNSIQNVIKLIQKEIKKYKIEEVRLISKEHIYLFLKDLELTTYYNHINYIHHKITGTKLNDISHLTEKLLQDFDQFIQMHHKLYPDENFNYQFLLFQLLMRHKYNCSFTDFNFLKTTERKVNHDSMCKEVFEELGWNYVSVF
jgi:hypothetical protein